MGRISNSYRASQSYFRHILRERKTLQTAHSTHHGDFFDIWHTTVHPKSPWFMLETVLNRILHNPVSRCDWKCSKCRSIVLFPSILRDGVNISLANVQNCKNSMKYGKKEEWVKLSFSVLFSHSAVVLLDSLFVMKWAENGEEVLMTPVHTAAEGS